MKHVWYLYLLEGRGGYESYTSSIQSSAFCSLSFFVHDTDTHRHSAKVEKGIKGGYRKLKGQENTHTNSTNCRSLRLLSNTQ